MPKFDVQHAREIVELASSCLLPVQDAEILPSAAYTSETFWEFERQAIFEREWLCIGHVNEVPDAGDHLPLTVLDEPLLMVRGADKVVRVLSAICQHRGHPLIGGVKSSPSDGACLNARRLVCPYHSWVYDLEGRFVGAPAMGDTTSLDELRQTVRLPEIRTEIFHGLVFINFDRQAEPVAKSLAKLEPEFSGYGLENLKPGHVFAQEDLSWNWKLHHENALEPYHTDYIHKGYHNTVPAHLTEFDTFEIGQGQVMRTTGYATASGDLFESSGERRLPDIEGLSEEQRSRVLFVSIMPCAVAVLQPSSVTITFLSPKSAGVIGSRRVNLYSQQALNSPDFAEISRDQFNQMKIIIMQDQTTQEALQQAYHSRFTPRGHLSHLETAITQLNQWIVEKYRRALDSAEA